MKSINIRKILAAVDFSQDSLNALQMAVSLAVQHDAVLHLLHVVDHDYDLKKADGGEPLHFTDKAKQLGELSKKIIDEYGVRCYYVQEYGCITHALLKTALNLNADLMIMGKNGASGSADQYAGSHACQVTGKSSIPVIVVPGKTVKYKFERILFPVRPLLSVPDKYELIRKHLLTHKPAVTLLNLRDPAHEKELHIIHQLTGLLKERLVSDGIPFTLEYYFKDSHFADQVIAMCDRQNQPYDLAVITSGVSAAGREDNLGFYARHILHQSTIPLLMLRSDNALPGADETLQQLETSAAGG